MYVKCRLSGEKEPADADHSEFVTQVVCLVARSRSATLSVPLFSFEVISKVSLSGETASALTSLSPECGVSSSTLPDSRSMRKTLESAKEVSKRVAKMDFSSGLHAAMDQKWFLVCSLVRSRTSFVSRLMTAMPVAGDPRCLRVTASSRLEGEK